MRRIKMFPTPIVIIAVLVMAGIPQVLSADGFIKIGNIQGSSLDIRHTGWSDIISVSSPVTKSVLTPTGTSRTHTEITITKVWDAASPQLMTALATGQKMDTVHIEFLPTGDSSGATTYTMTNVTILSVKSGVDPKTGAKVEAVTLLAEELK